MQLVDVQKQFINTIIDAGVLVLEEDGYYFNSDKINSGNMLNFISAVFAVNIIHYNEENKLDFNIIHSVEKELIPLAPAISMQIIGMASVDTGFSYFIKDNDFNAYTQYGYNVKDNGVLLVSCELSDGKKVMEDIDRIQALDGKVTAIMVAIDRQQQEESTGKLVSEFIKDNYGVDVYSVMSFSDFVANAPDNLKEKISKYK